MGHRYELVNATSFVGAPTAARSSVAQAAARSISPSISGPSLFWTKKLSGVPTIRTPFFLSVRAILDAADPEKSWGIRKRVSNVAARRLFDGPTGNDCRKARMGALVP